VREDHWVVADLIGKGKHIRTVPVPEWAKRAVDEWTRASGITSGVIFRCEPARASVRRGECEAIGLRRKQSGTSLSPQPCAAEFRNSLRTTSGARVRDSGRWRTRSDSISFRPRICADNGTIPRMQAEA
jgi:hypothetical protein